MRGLHPRLCSERPFGALLTGIPNFRKLNTIIYSFGFCLRRYNFFLTRRNISANTAKNRCKGGKSCWLMPPLWGAYFVHNYSFRLPKKYSKKALKNRWNNLREGENLLWLCCEVTFTRLKLLRYPAKVGLSQGKSYSITRQKMEVYTPVLSYISVKRFWILTLWLSTLTVTVSCENASF